MTNTDAPDVRATYRVQLHAGFGFDDLHEVLELQHYRLARWRGASEELNYRRFFAINDLAALRAENPEVFRQTHSLVLDLVERGDLQGLRIDHIDGLRRPDEYLRNLRTAAPGVYVVVEKILERDETLPDWPVEGTTGYDFLNRVSGLFVDPDGAGALTSIYETFTGDVVELDEQRREKKLAIADTELASDIERLGVRRSPDRAGPCRVTLPDAHQANGPWSSGHLPRMRVLGPEPRRPRQPAPGRLRPPARAAHEHEEGRPRFTGRRHSGETRLDELWGDFPLCILTRDDE